MAGAAPAHVSRRSLKSTRAAGASRTTVLIALAANALIAVAKLIGGLASGSTALLAEAAHSLADTTNQAFLLGSISLAAREPTETHPFGHGNQRFLWTFVAAVGMFVAGAVFAVGYGVVELASGAKERGGFAAGWITLVIAVLAEGASWVRALRQTRGQARRADKPISRYVAESRDPSVKMVLFEDSAALVGVALAAAGIALHQITGSSFWDPVASILIGLLLIGVAARMAYDTGGLLVGAAALPEEREAIERVLAERSAVDEVIELLTLVLGPNALLVAARIDIADGITGDQLEQAMSDLDRAIREAVPDVTEVFLDPTPSRGR